jgi:hypothetical protein
MDTLDIDITRVRALQSIASAFARLKWLRDAERFELAMRRHALALKAGFKPEQPRDELGRWTDANGNGAAPRQNNLPARIPGSVPEIPRKKPKTSGERVAAYKLAARALVKFAGPVGVVFEATSWLYNHRPLIEAYNDPPKSLEELQQNVSLWRLGYDTHHVVEKGPAKAQGDPSELIDGPDNLVSIPRMRHWDLNRWYETPSREFGDQTPREYLAGKSWEERRRVGLRGLVEVGVLKP